MRRRQAHNRTLGVFWICLYFCAFASALSAKAQDDSVADDLRRLKDKDYRVRYQAAQNLGYSPRDPRVCKPLVAALKDQNSIVRGHAAEALGRIKGCRLSVEPLISALEDENAFVQRMTFEALGEIGDQRAVEPLIKALQDGNPEIRQMAAQALGQLKDPRAVQSLQELANAEKQASTMATSTETWKQHDSAYRAAKGALDNITRPAAPPPPPRPNLSVVQGLIRELGTTNDPKKINSIQQTLIYNLDEAVHYWGSIDVILSFAKLSSPSRAQFALPSLVRALASDVEVPNPGLYLEMGPPYGVTICSAAAWTLKQNGLATEAFHLVEQDPQLFSKSYKGIIYLGVSESVPHLIALLQESGNTTMAEEFLNSGNGELATAARDWAKLYGYAVGKGITPGLGVNPSWDVR